MSIAVQVVCLILILLLGLFVFKRYPFQYKLRSTILVSLFLVLALVLSYFSMMLGLFGFPTLKIGLAQLPLMLVGVVFGPGYAFIAGILYDVLGLIVTPTNFPFLGFTLSNILVCTIPALWLKESMKIKESALKKVLPTIFFTIAMCFIIYLWTYTFSDTFTTSVMKLDNMQRLMITVGIPVYTLLLYFVVNKVIKRITSINQTMVYQWVIAVLLVEIIANLLLTPYWLYTMYGVPYILNFFVRVLKLMIMIPLNSIIGITVWKVIRKLYRSS